MEVLGKEQRAVGQYISTKAVGRNARLDLTREYKAREGERFKIFCTRHSVPI